MNKAAITLIALTALILFGCKPKMREEKITGEQAGRMKVISEQRLSMGDGSSYRVVILSDTETSRNYLVIPSIGLTDMNQGE